MKKYYLAYGSNLNVQQMKYRCPDAKPVGTAWIHGYQSLFKGSKTGSYLTIEKTENSKFRLQSGKFRKPMNTALILMRDIRLSTTKRKWKSP